MKKIIFLIGMLLAATVVDAQAPIAVVATTGQIADIASNVGGDLVRVQSLMGPGVDPHLYRASESDVGKLSRADIIFYNGLHLEAKMGEVLERLSAKRRVVAVSQGIPRESLLSDPVYPEVYDPHIWFDVSLWKKAVENIEQAFSEISPKHKDVFQANAQKYLNSLDELSGLINQRVLEVEPSQRVLVTAHDAFRYFGKAYGFEVVGLQGISTQAEAGAKDVAHLADLIAKRKIKAVFVESSVPQRNIRAVQEAVKARGWTVNIGGELFSDALGSQGTPEGTYIGMVTHNINTIVGALK